jgi:hypothetical protein
MREIATAEEAAQFLDRVRHWIGAFYGGTEAHHIVSKLIRELESTKGFSPG